VDKATFWRGFTKRLLNPLTAPVLGLIPGWALLETRGRRTGRPRRTPVGDGLRGEVFWIVAEHGHRADYVRNIAADPRVRIKRRGRWRTGTATILPADDPRGRQRQLRLNPANALMVRAVGSRLLTIRVDLANPPSAQDAPSPPLVQPADSRGRST
jgi:deazaflavin-dependent oxidoreductase (nitroreductase family)